MRVRGMIRWVITAAAALVALVVVGLAVVWIALSTEWGHDVVRRRVERALDGTLRGKVSIARLEGNLLGAPVAVDVRVHDLEGHELARIARLAIEVDVWKLLDREVHVRSLVIETPRIAATQAADGSIDLFDVIPPPKPDEKPFDWAVHVDALTISDGTIAWWPAVGDGIVLDDVQVRGGHGTVTVDAREVRVTGLELAAGSSSIAIPRAVIAREGGALSADLVIAAAAADVATWTHDDRWLADVGVVATVGRTGLADPWTIAVDGAVADAPLRVDAQVASTVPPSGRAHVTVRDLDPSRVYAAGPPARGDATLDASFGDDAVDATVHAGGTTEIGVGEVTARVRGAVDDLTADVTAALHGLRAGDARVREVALELHATGLPDAARGTVAVRASGIASGTQRISAARLDARFTDAARAIAGSLVVGRRGDPYEGSLVVRVARRAELVVVDVVQLAARTRGIAWTGQGGRLVVATTPGGAIALDHLALRSELGAFEASGRLAQAGDRLAVDARGLDLARLQATFAPAGATRAPVGGTVDAHVTIERRARRIHAATVALQGRALTFEHALDPFSVGVEATLAGRVLSAKADVDGGRIGTLGLAIETRTPVDPIDLAAWAKLDERDVRTIRVSLARVDLAGLADLLNVGDRTRGLRGRLDGTIEAKIAGPDRVHADLRFTDVRTASLMRPLAARLEAALGEDHLHATVTSTLGGGKLLAGELTLDAGLAALRAGAATRLQTAPIHARATITKFPLEAIGDAFGVRRKVPFPGTLDARVDATGSLAAPQVVGKVTAAQRTGGTLAADLAVDFATQEAARVTVRATRFDLGFLAFQDTTSALGVGAGVLDADLKVNGARLDGWAHLTGGRVRATELLETFHDADLRLTIEGGKTVTGVLDTRVGRGGRLHIDGDVTMTGLEPGPLHARMKGSKISVAAPGTRAKVDFEGTVTGRPGQDAYRLDVALARSTVNLPDALRGETLHSTAPLEDVVYVDRFGQVVHDEHAQGAPSIRVVVRSKTPTLVRGVLTRSEVTTRLDLLLGAALPEIRGHVQIDRGFVELFGRRWEVQEARAVLDGAVPADPRLDVRLVHEFETATVTIAIRGKASEPQVTLTSDDTRFDQSQLLGFVLGGSPDDDIGGAGEADPQANAVNAASSLVFAKVQPLVRKVVPVDVVAVKQEGAGTTTLLTVGKWLTRDIFVAYQHRFPDRPDEVQNANEGTLEWYFRRRWRTELVFGDRGEGSADVLWLNRW